MRRRNTSITPATINTLSISATCTSCSADLVVWVRSKIGVICRSAGSHARICGSLARTASAVATALASGRLLMRMAMARWSLNQAAWNSSCWPLVTLATSDKRTGAPLCTASSRLANSSGVCSASLAVTVICVLPSLSVPCGEETLAARSMLATSLAVSPLAASATVSRSTRTARGRPPITRTCATPGICASAGFNSESARSYNRSGGTVCEVIASSSTGMLAVLNL